MGAASRIDLRFEPPPTIVIAERRLAGRVLDAWTATGGARVVGFDDHALVIADPGGAARLVGVGGAIAESFGLAAGMTLGGGRCHPASLAAELRAACDLIAVEPRPVPFEAKLAAPGRACLLVRGIALPIGDGMPGGEKIPAEQVQVFISWRMLLDRAATTRLRSALVAARREWRPDTSIDPFAPAPAEKRLVIDRARHRQGAPLRQAGERE